MIFVFRTLLVLLFLVPLPLLAEEKRRVALVIGNSSYETVDPLKNPVNDARDIAEALTRIGFDVTLKLNLNDEQMRSSLKEFSNLSRNADLSLLYFAGHGIEVDKTNYLIPVDARLVQDEDVAFEAVQLNTVVRAISGSGGVKIILVDACRNNPFANRLKSGDVSRSVGNGLSRVDPVGGILPGGIMISYAAREGTYALDGEGRNSPYAQGLLENIEEPGLEVGKLFRKVRDYVFELTDGSQEPFTYGSLPGTDIYLVSGSDQGNRETLTKDTERSETLTEFYRAEWTNTPLAWHEFISRNGERDSELLEIAKQRLVALGADAMLRTLEKDDNPWLIPEAGLPPRGSVDLNNEERKLVQKAMMYMGYDLGNIDGQFGKKTKSVISAVRLETGLPAGFEIDANLLRRLPNVIEIDRLKSKQAKFVEGSHLAASLERRLAKALAVLDGYKLVFDYFRGHLYIAVRSDRWAWAQTEKLARKAGGHLVTISDKAENEFVYDLIKEDQLFFAERWPGYYHGPQIGLVQADQTSEPNGGWVWITGEEFDYSAWAAGQPDNEGVAGGKYARYAGTGSRPSRWGDDWGAGGVFVMEVE